MAAISDNSGSRRLNGWKEIAAYFGKDERTVKRWEAQNGLPVHRLPGGNRGTVFADVAELEHWLVGHRTTADAAGADTPQPAVTGPAARPVSRGTGILAGVFVSCAVVGLFAGDTLRQWIGPAPRVSDIAPGQASIRELYLDGLTNLGLRTPAGLSRAVENFTQIVSRDPANAPAYAQLAIAYNLLTQYASMPADIAYPQAKAAAQRAIQLDPGLATGYAALAFAEHYWDRDFSGAREHFDKAIELDPRAPQTLGWFALTRMQAGDFEAAQELIDRAQELEPSSRAIIANRALILFHAGASAEAERLLLQLKQSAPNQVAAHFYLASIYLDEARYEDYVAESLAAAELQDNEATRSIFLAARAGYQRGGSTAMFSAMLDEQRRQFAQGREQAFNVARTAGEMGDAETALDYLHQSVERREQDILGIRIDRSFRKLWDEPRFRAVAAGVGLPFPEQRAANL